MNRQAFLEMMEDILNLPEGSLKGDERLDSLPAWDSVTAVAVIAMARESAGAALRPEDVRGAEDLGALYALIAREK